MDDLIPRKSWTLAFEEMEDVVFHLKELTDQEYLELMDILDPLYNEGTTKVQRDTLRIKAVDFMLIDVEGMKKEDISWKIKLNIANQVIDYCNPDVLEVKK